MPIVDGRYETRISTTFATVDEARESIMQKMKKSRRIRINNIPTNLLEQLMPLLKDKDLKIILPIGETPTADLKELGNVATTKARIYVDYQGKEASTGSIYFSDEVFNIAWLGNEILSVSTMEYGKCVKCMMETFEGAWRYSHKW